MKYPKLQKLADEAQILKIQLRKSRVAVITDYEYRKLEKFYRKATPKLILQLLKAIEEKNTK